MPPFGGLAKSHHLIICSYKKIEGLTQKQIQMYNRSVFKDKAALFFCKLS
jgi:hypothetical protein